MHVIRHKGLSCTTAVVLTKIQMWQKIQKSDNFEWISVELKMFVITEAKMKTSKFY